MAPTRGAVGICRRSAKYLGGSDVQTAHMLKRGHSRLPASPIPMCRFETCASCKRHRGAIFAAPEAQLVEYLLAHPGRAAFIVDEGVTLTEDELGARTLGDLVRGGRHFGLEAHLPSQRVTDWFDSASQQSKWSGVDAEVEHVAGCKPELRGGDRTVDHRLQLQPSGRTWARRSDTDPSHER